MLLIIIKTLFGHAQTAAKEAKKEIMKLKKKQMEIKIQKLDKESKVFLIDIIILIKSKVNQIIQGKIKNIYQII